MGFDKTYYSIRLHYYWPKLYNSVQRYVAGCVPCQKAKHPSHAKSAALNPIPTGDIFHRVHVDLVGPLPITPTGHRYVMMITDSYSKWLECFPLKTQDAKETASVFITKLFVVMALRIP